MRKSVVEVGQGFDNRTVQWSPPPNWKSQSKVPTQRTRSEKEKRILGWFAGWKKGFLPFVIFWLWWTREENQ